MPAASVGTIATPLTSSSENAPSGASSKRRGERIAALERALGEARTTYDAAAAALDAMLVLLSPRPNQCTLLATASLSPTLAADQSFRLVGLPERLLEPAARAPDALVLVHA